MPGQVKGRVQTRWLAPDVSVTTRSIGTGSTVTVQWFTPEGKLAHDLAGANVTAHPGYVYDYGEGKGTIHGVNGDWKIGLPQKAGPAGYITATEDGRTFVHEFHPEEGKIAADIYRDGKLAGTIGPFLQYHSQDVQLGADGSLALLVWKEKDKTVQVVGVGPDARVRFQVDCEGSVMSPIPAPDGAGVLVHANAAGQARNTFSYHTKAGRLSSLNVGPNAGFLAWLPGTTRALMHTSIGYDYRFHLIDWSTGKRLWDIPDPNTARVPGSLPAIAVVKDYLLIGGLKYVPLDGHEGPVRSIHALNQKTGQTVAQWLPDPLSQKARDEGRFLNLDGKVFLVSDEEFAEVNLDDIPAKCNGWK
jgi:hypothetical protein